MNVLKWVHLSDLHMQEKDAFNRSRVLKSLFEDLKSREKIDPNLQEIDAIFFTGDMAYHGYKKEYDLANNEFIEPLLKVTNINKDRLFIVPGNHDIDISHYQKYAKVWREQLISADDITQFLDNSEDQSLVQPRLNNYMECLAKPLFEKELEMPGWFHVNEINIGNKQVAILCLNTAWLCTGDEKDRPCLGERQIVEALNYSKESDLIISLFHHPIGKLKDIDDTHRCENLLTKEISLLLQGHLHRPDARSVLSSSGACVQISAGAIFEKRNSPLSYNFGYLDLDTGKGFVFFRTYFPTRNEWAKDIEATGKEYDGKMQIKVDLQRESVESELKDTFCELTSASALPLSENPFSTVAAESMNVEEVTRLFVGTHTKLDTAQKRFGTIIEGQRGTGKSMILKYLSFPVQIKIWQDKGKKVEDYFKSQGYIGIYCKLEQGVFDKPDLDAIDDLSKRNHIFEHRITSVICVDIIENVKEIMLQLKFDTEKFNNLTSRLERIINAPREWIASSENIFQILNVYRDHFRKEAREVDEFLRSQCKTSFRARLTLSGTMCDLLEIFQEELNIKECCFFLLLDDFDVLHDWQQQILFSVAAQRRFDLICFKFGVMSEGIKTILSGDRRTFRPGDDYDPISLDMIERGMLRNDYPDAVSLITAKRLRESGWPIFYQKELPEKENSIKSLQKIKTVANDILNVLFQEWEFGKNLRQEVKESMYAEWEEATKKPTQKKHDYFSKYGNARYFQKLSKKRKSEQYAAYEYIVLISSGIVRQFLEICSQIVSEAYKERWSPQAGNGISPQIQDRAIRQYSKAFYENLNKGAGAHGTAEDLGQGITSEEVTTLIEALSDLFYERLHCLGHGEPEIITFSLKDSTPYVENLLKVCVRESVLQKFSYPSKTAGKGHFRAYILNRRLIPRRSLSALRMQGRIEMSSDDIKQAIADKKNFVKKFMPYESEKHKGFEQREFSEITEDNDE